LLTLIIIYFLDLEQLPTPHQYCDAKYGGGGGNDGATSSGAQQGKNPGLDLSLRL